MTEQEAQMRMRALMTRIQTEGAEVAFDAALQILKDPNASAQARAANVNSVWRAGGLFESKKGDQVKSPEDMTPAELNARILELRARQNIPLTEFPLGPDDDQDEDDKPNDMFG